MKRGSRSGSLARIGLAGALALAAAGQGVRELALAWVQGDYRAPLACVVEGVSRQALRRVRIHPGPREAARPSVRATFFDLDAPPGTPCRSISGQAEPNVIGTLELVWDARTRNDTGTVDFRNTLRREGGFDFKVEGGRLRIGSTEQGAEALRTLDFAGGTARFESVAPGSDAARRLAGLGGHRQLLLTIEAPGAAPLSFDLVELPPR